ncbi:MAG: hypothetical protein FWD03_06835 [Defluviitaleaceae bacterium]|nr:hypothetical protein [Defluviitaleaceae bacterium]
MDRIDRMDRDEIKIKEALNTIHTPDYDIAASVQASLAAQGEKRKRRPFKMKAITSAAAVILLVIVSAMTVNIISHFGYDYSGAGAGTVTVIESPIVPEPIEQIDPPEAVYLVDDPTEPLADIQIEIISAYVSNNTIDIYLLMQDLEHNRLDDNIRIEISIGNEMGTFNWVSRQLDVIDYDPDEGTVIIHLRQTFLMSEIDINDQALSLTIYRLFYGIRDHQEVIPIDLSTIGHNPETLHIQPLTPVFSWWKDNYDEERIIDFTTRIYEQGIDILPPHQLDLAFGTSGLELVISNIGVIDGQLRVQTYENVTETSLDSELPSLMWEIFMMHIRTRLFLIDPDGNHIREQAGIGFDVTRDWIVPDYGWQSNIYDELMFDVDISRLAEYHLAKEFRTMQHMELDWHTTFNAAPISGLPFEDLNIHLDEFDLVITEAQLTQNTLVLRADDRQGREILINVRGDPWVDTDTRRELEVGDEGPPWVLNEADIRIITEDGEVHVQQPIYGLSSGGSDDRSSIVLFYYVEPQESLDLETVVGIEIAGVLIVR